MSEMPATSKEEERVVKELRAIVGEKNATAAKHVRYAYSYDMSFVQPKLPDYVVMAENVEHRRHAERNLAVPVDLEEGGFGPAGGNDRAVKMLGALG